MTLNKFVFGVIFLLFGYNYLIVKWNKYQERKRQRQRSRRDIRTRY